MYICELIFILIEPSHLCVKNLRPNGIGATKNNCRKSNGTYPQNVFHLHDDDFFAFEWSTWYLLLFSRSLRMELRTLFTGVYSVDCPLGHSVWWRGIEQLPTSLVCCPLG